MLSSVWLEEQICAIKMFGKDVCAIITKQKFMETPNDTSFIIT